MAKFCFTGNPFVDAGVAGMCAAVGVETPDKLDETAAHDALKSLKRVIGTEATFKKRKIGTKESAFATSEMSVIFPNGPLSQSSYPTVERKLAEYNKRLDRKLAAFDDTIAGQSTTHGYGSCFVDGSTAVMQVGNDEFPLVDSKSKRNFHPGLQGGHAIGAVTAIALEFFPLSVLRTGVNSGLFWFVHTANEKIAIACARMTLAAMNEAIARSEGLGFFGKWDIPSRNADAALVALIRDLMTGSGQAGKPVLSSAEFEKSKYPVTAYVFSNDNRGPTIVGHDLPHRLFRFFLQLHARQATFQRFNREVLQSDKTGWLVAKRMLLCESLVTISSVKPEGENVGYLRGGWQAQSYYMTEVLGMSSVIVRDVEAISERIVNSEKANDMILTLQKETANRALQRLCRSELLSFDEYARLVPPDDRQAAFAARDYLLAAIYERLSVGKRGESFIAWDGEEETSLTDKHPLVKLAEGVGSKLASDPDLGKRMAFDIAQARRLPELRRAVLRTIRSGVLSWSEFIALFPPEKTWVSFLMRDYLLAYLYTALRDPGLPDPEVIADKAAAEFQG